MNVFDIITSTLAPTTQTAKGSIVTIAKNATKVYDTYVGDAKVIATYDTGKLLGTLQETRKVSVIRNGVITKEVFFMVKVKLSDPIKEQNWVSANKTYYDGWVLAESLDVYNGGTASTSSVSPSDSAIYSTGTGVNVRYSAQIIGGIKDKVNNIVSVFSKGDLIGYSNLMVTNGFYKVKFVTPQTSKSNGKSYTEGYVSITYANAVQPATTTTTNSSKTSTTPSKQQNEASKTVKDDEKYAGVSQTDDSENQTFMQKYSYLLIGGAIVGLIGVIVYAVNKLGIKSKINGIISNTPSQ